MNEDFQDYWYLTMSSKKDKANEKIKPHLKHRIEVPGKIFFNEYLRRVRAI
jgi:hypothetical protein